MRNTALVDWKHQIFVSFSAIKNSGSPSGLKSAQQIYAVFFCEGGACEPGAAVQPVHEPQQRGRGLRPSARLHQRFRLGGSAATALPQPRSGEQCCGSGAFWPWIRIRNEQPRLYFREPRNNFFGLKYLNSLMPIRDGKFQIRDPRWKKFGSRDKHPESATVVVSLQNVYSVWLRIQIHWVSLLDYRIFSCFLYTSTYRICCPHPTSAQKWWAFKTSTPF